MNILVKNVRFLVVALALLGSLLTLDASMAAAQESLPVDNGLATYHTAPRYRDSESHPLRIAAYILHPVGWVARELIFRPLSYFASSTEVTRSVMGFREPFDYRQPECFSADDSAPDCRSVSPFNYEATTQGTVVAPAESEDSSLVTGGDRQVYFPDVNFNFNSRKLNDLGRGRCRQIAALLEKAPGLKVVLQGHTDYIGSDKYNEKLGLDRSEAVRKELVSLGVSPDRLSTVTFGLSQPLLPEKENWARAVNRRVEIHTSGDVPVAPVATKDDEAAR